MSKYLKNLIADELKKRLEGVSDAVLVNVIGMDANANNRLRLDLREKNIELLVVKNSLAQRATEGTELAPAFADIDGTAAVMWGGEDIVALCREAVRVAGEKHFAPFAPRGGVMDGAPLSADDVIDVSKWPTREEQLSKLSGQILGPGASLVAALLGPGRSLASQIKSKSEGEEGEAA